jgi:hypothetical protein
MTNASGPTPGALVYRRILIGIVASCSNSTNKATSMNAAPVRLSLNPVAGSIVDQGCTISSTTKTTAPSGRKSKIASDNSAKAKQAIKMTATIEATP